MSNYSRACYSSPIGFLHISQLDEAITSIHFMQEPLNNEHTSPLLTQVKNELHAYFHNGLRQFSFPIQQQGTSFQNQVWDQLLQIPYGTTISYLEMARRLGDEKKIRAAGTANGKNQLAIVVPCHRVIGSNGQLVGYAGGLWRKEWLLKHEGALSPDLFS